MVADRKLERALGEVLQLARERKCAESLARIDDLLAACGEADRSVLEGCRAFLQWRAAIVAGRPWGEGLAEAVAGIAWLRQAASPPLIGWACSALGAALGQVGDFEAGLEWLEVGIEDALARNDRRQLVASHMQKGGLLLFADDPDRALAIFEQSHALCEGELESIRAGTLSDMSYCAIVMARRPGISDSERTDLAQRALDHATAALNADESPEYALWELEALSNQGAALSLLGRAAEAEVAFRRGLASAKASTRVHAELVVGYAELLIGDGRYAQAAELLGKPPSHAPSLVDPTTDRTLELQIEVARSMGRGEDAHALWERRFRNMEERYRLRLRNVRRHADIFAELKQARLAEQQARTLATTDHLTGASTRLHLEELAEGEIRRARRYGRPLSVIVFDLDHFKSINDRFGHSVGDRVLVDITQRVRQNLRSSDVLARWGGEEFAVLLPESDANDAWRLAEKLRALIAGKPIQGVGTVTASFGAASLIADEPLAELLIRADRALYGAKEAGRGTVRMAE